MAKGSLLRSDLANSEAPPHQVLQSPHPALPPQPNFIPVYDKRPTDKTSKPPPAAEDPCMDHTSAPIANHQLPRHLHPIPNPAAVSCPSSTVGPRPTENYDQIQDKQRPLLHSSHVFEDTTARLYNITRHSELLSSCSCPDKILCMPNGAQRGQMGEFCVAHRITGLRDVILIQPSKRAYRRGDSILTYCTP